MPKNSRPEIQFPGQILTPAQQRLKISLTILTIFTLLALVCTFLPYPLILALGPAALVAVGSGVYATWQSIRNRQILIAMLATIATILSGSMALAGFMVLLFPNQLQNYSDCIQLAITNHAVDFCTNTFKMDLLPF